MNFESDTPRTRGTDSMMGTVGDRGGSEAVNPEEVVRPGDIEAIRGKKVEEEIFEQKLEAAEDDWVGAARDLGKKMFSKGHRHVLDSGNLKMDYWTTEELMIFIQYQYVTRNGRQSAKYPRERQIRAQALDDYNFYILPGDEELQGSEWGKKLASERTSDDILTFLRRRREIVKIMWNLGSVRRPVMEPNQEGTDQEQNQRASAERLFILGRAKMMAENTGKDKSWVVKAWGNRGEMGPAVARHRIEQFLPYLKQRKEMALVFSSGEWKRYEEALQNRRKIRIEWTDRLVEQAKTPDGEKVDKEEEFTEKRRENRAQINKAESEIIIKFGSELKKEIDRLEQEYSVSTASEIKNKTRDLEIPQQIYIISIVTGRAPQGPHDLGRPPQVAQVAQVAQEPLLTGRVGGGRRTKKRRTKKKKKSKKKKSKRKYTKKNLRRNN